MNKYAKGAAPHLPESGSADGIFHHLRTDVLYEKVRAPAPADRADRWANLPINGRIFRKIVNVSGNIGAEFPGGGGGRRAASSPWPENWRAGGGQRALPGGNITHGGQRRRQ